MEVFAVVTVIWGVLAYIAMLSADQTPAYKRKGRRLAGTSPYRRQAELLQAYADAISKPPRSVPQADGE